ncbi:hypothetical protein B0F90DRAFT_1811021 [Multifurca ochricompacta]|uniref:ubiquitinyl hydrolase 1 n=1 Tax=Multifurca ochricompacta TaxID=376703 RepID=A0AAD4M0Z8_9AGAM|nr:hypothetical protein B0F90DRAFT_1811021 [Multifurca ochricompacta]
MSIPVTDIDSGVLRTIIEHVFMPPKLPQKAPTVEAERGTNTALCRTLIQAAFDFAKFLSPAQQLTWVHMIKMMFFTLQLAEAPLSETVLQQILSKLAVGDVFVMHVRAQNAAVVVRKLIYSVQIEMFEVSPLSSVVTSTQGKLLSSYPGPAVQISPEVFETECFLRELASFLVQMDVDVLDSSAISHKAGSIVREVRETAHPKYITGLLVGILRGFGQPAVVDRITKRIGDEVLWKDAYQPWRRSPLWLVIRVTLQTSLGHSFMYKHFMLFYHAYLLQKCTLKRGFQSELLYAMSVKMARRLAKIAVYSAAKRAEGLLQKRWTTFQMHMSLAPPWCPEKLDLIADTAITLDNSRPYLMKAFIPASRNVSQNIFTPSHQQRLDDTSDFALFTGDRLTKAIGADQRTALADFELSVENYLDSWVASSKDKDSTPDYFAGAKQHYEGNPEDNSIMILTIMDLWKALDTVTVQQFPRDFLHPLLLHRSEYVCRRHEGASSTTSIFSDKAFFRDSPELQQLYNEINQHAFREREMKRQELSRLNEEWQSLQNEASGMSHSYSKTRKGVLTHHNCEKCGTEKRAKRLKIDIHEWPLPQEDSEAQLVVFELSPPRAFSAWREITYKIIRDIGLPGGSNNFGQPKLLLAAFSGLKNWAVRHPYHRITIGVQIPAGESLVLVNNGLSFRLFDRTSASWAAGQFSGSNVTNYAKPPTPVSGPYHKLHSFVCGTQHTSNQSIASQGDCPEELSIHEYVAFSAKGVGITLTLVRREEVHTLITQAAWQLGPLTDGVREWHTDLGISAFGRTLLKELEALLERVKANWLEEVTVRTVALATSRLLSSAKDPEICKQACTLLRKARSVTHMWIGELTSKLDTTQDEKSRANLRLRVCVLAATCLSTFDVCLENVPNVLSTNHDFAIAVKCAIIVHDNTPSSVEGSSFYRLLNRHHRLLHLLEPFFRQGVRSRPEGFDFALASLWLGFRRQASSSWQGGHEVHYNILTGRLLVGGKPLGRLPQVIIQHPTYASIFRTRVLDVVPADIAEMEFMTRSTVFGYQILFSLHDEDLIVQARRPGGSLLLQFVPHTVFTGDFPKTFVKDYVHWLDLDTREVEFRPSTSPWTPDPSNWKLHVHSFRNSTSIFLVDMRSATFKMISQLLLPLESPENVIITRSPQTLEASLHRLRLAFFHAGYVIDKIQSSGTMFGLRNQLVLCHGSGASELPRRVIIPEGDVSFTLDGNFANVSIETGTKSPVHWHEYNIDTNLGRLTGSVSLRSKLYQCYLHALTSHCLPDRLLGHTGTEESLGMLRSAAFNDLTPRRVYYPPHINSMATVEWADLPTFSQHHDFHTAVRSILDHADAIEALIRSQSPSPFLNGMNHYFIAQHFATRCFTHKSCNSRDSHTPSSGRHAAYQMSWSTWNAKPSPSPEWLQLWQAIQSWRSIGPASSNISLRYNRYWLDFNAAQDFLGIYNAVNNLRICLAFTLSAASFSRSAVAGFLPLILIFATDIRFRGLRPPPDLVFKRLEALIVQCAHRMDLTPAKTMAVTDEQQMQEYNRIVEKQASEAASSIVDHWPGSASLKLSNQWFATSSCRGCVDVYLRPISQNNELKCHIERLQGILSDYGSTTFSGLPYTFSPRFDRGTPKIISYSMQEVLASRADVPPPLSCEEPIVIPSNVTVGARSSPQLTGEGRLRSLIQEFRHSQESLLRLYGDDLENSHSALVGKRTPLLTQRVIPSYEVLRDHRDRCSARKDIIFSELSKSLKPSQKIEKVISAAGLWPRITPRSILRELSRDRVDALTGLWKYAVTTYQQSQRLLELSSRVATKSSYDVAAVCSEDWLLIQIDGNFLARPLQLAIAREMVSPSSGRSSSLQLNMGEGKSSVIVPLVAATLANGSRLVRVVTLKPLSNQMFQLLLSRLSGLADRPIFYIPFSRDLRMTAPLVQNISALYRRCVADGGVLVIQPEHILSQKLMCIDFLLASHNDNEKTPLTLSLKLLQDWLEKVSRDVLDESDEILHVRYQLVYTAGGQKPVEDFPNRWCTTQQVFSRLRAHSAQLHAKFPKIFELRILDREVSLEISSLIVDDALGGALSSLPSVVLSPQFREATRRFIIQRDVSDEDHDLIRSQCSGTTLWRGILLLRGLLVDGEGILGYVLKERRWRVDYGLDPGRTPMAVPYRAKDVPSLRAEFGHPDVAIALTCLSYYYGGLTKEQVLLCFDLLSKLDNPEMEYDQWVESGKDLPVTLRQLNGVNTKDDIQVDEFIGVDFYLSQVVFPRAAKEFPSKLSTSPGIFGTNDNRYLLPTSISQEDPVSQLSTNALVLQYLLQPENNHYESAIFFNDSDHLTVLTQDGMTEPFISSPFNRQLDKCVIYLDDAHTRGTDLKLPRGTRAAVTLGPKTDNDAGCMRMRQLGKGQSVMFFAPGEVDRRIRNLIPSEGGPCYRVDVLDILRWAMHETCEDTRHHLPHWAEQGLDHHKRFAAYKLHSWTGNLGTLKGTWLQPESRTLEEILRERIERLGMRTLADVRMAEEQEREVNHEIERERQVERPPKVYPAQHVICDVIRAFVRTGILAKSSRYILPLFAPTGIHTALDSVSEWSPSPLATADFATTTTNSNGSELTDYLRPINWVLSSGSGKDSTVIVISPHEANEVTASMRSFSDLGFYSIPVLPTGSWSPPAHVRMELNLFAGQLYFDSREEYERICALLALHMVHPSAERIEVDGFVPPQYRTGESSPFTTSKITLFKKLIGLRRKGMAYGGTDLGRVLDARPLSSDFA